MPEQLSLFDSLILQAANISVKNTTSTKAEAPVEVKSKKTESSTPTKLTPPQKIVDLLDGVHTVEDLSVKCNVPFSHAVHGNVIYSDLDPEVQSKYSRSLNFYYGTTKVYQRNVVQIGPSNSNYYHREEDTVNLLYVDEDCNPWTAKIEISANGMPFSCHIEKKKWQIATRLQVYSPIQSIEQIRTIMQKKMPYTVKFCDEVDGDLLTFLIAPQLEHLDKAGYLFARSFFKACSLTDGLTAYQKTRQDELDKFNRLIVRTVTPGKIKNVFKTSAEVAKVLKEERRIDVWDTYRILDKFGRIKQDDIQQAYDAGLTPGDLRLVNSILNKRYNNKPIFSFGSLMNYLGRIDMYEAIDKRDVNLGNGNSQKCYVRWLDMTDHNNQVNAWRNQNGQPSLAIISDPNDARYQDARTRAVEVAYMFSHRSPWCIAEDVYGGPHRPAGGVGENIHSGTTAAFEAFRNSALHNGTMVYRGTAMATAACQVAFVQPDGVSTYYDRGRGGFYSPSTGSAEATVQVFYE